MARVKNPERHEDKPLAPNKLIASWADRPAQKARRARLRALAAELGVSPTVTAPPLARYTPDRGVVVDPATGEARPGPEQLNPDADGPTHWKHRPRRGRRARLVGAARSWAARRKGKKRAVS